MMFPLVTAAAVLWTAALPAAVSPTASLQDPTPAPAPAAGIPECKDMKKTASGLEYGVLKEGRKEASPGKDDVVEVHYTGWLTDGTKFDSSRDRGEPTSFGVSQVVKGWTEGLQLMTPGAHFKFVIPAELGYGAQARGKIPANSTMVFEVELLKVTSMPKFTPAGKELKDLAGGVKYEVTKVGTGAQVSDKVSLAMRYAIWRADGKLLDCSEKQNNHRIAGYLSTLPFPFLKDLAQARKVGDVVRAEVPKALFPNAGDDTVWELEVTGVTTLPTFRALDPSKVVTTESGLKYEVIEAGTGKSPAAWDTVVAHYSGWLMDGTLFDSSYLRGSTSEFPLYKVIKGWTEGLQLMKTGGKFLFEVPGELAYGKRGSPPKIPANATLVFLVELVEVRAGNPIAGLHLGGDPSDLEGDPSAEAPEGRKPVSGGAARRSAFDEAFEIINRGKPSNGANSSGGFSVGSKVVVVAQNTEDQKDVWDAPDGHILGKVKVGSELVVQSKMVTSSGAEFYQCTVVKGDMYDLQNKTILSGWIWGRSLQASGR